MLFATSIDHVLSTELALAEARRVSKPGGMVCVWTGEPEPPPPPEGLRESLWRRVGVMKVRTPQTTMRFRIPRGAVDPFHVVHPTVAELETLLEQAGLHVVEVQRPLEQRCFLRALVP